ncbi:MAG: fasciclin [Alphaproteobacteria bacterium HGW-Alphaproteobacteria-18]|nr:MAG: fasciclin [Alphaproteobacteria bacterium HGW-Alphaproteobacteria-18]
MKNLLMTAAAVVFFAAPATAAPPVEALLQPAQYWTGAGSETDTDLVDAAASTGAFTRLLSAAEAVGLDGELKGDGPYTVFAPTDAAFAKMPAGTLERLMAPENRDQLAALLKMHVIAGEKLMTADLEGRQLTAQTLNGPLAIDASDAISGVRVNNAGVTLPDIEASNGVIHAIDTVLLPGR